MDAPTDTTKAGNVVPDDSVQALRELVLLRTLNILAFAVPLVSLMIVIQAQICAERGSHHAGALFLCNIVFGVADIPGHPGLPVCSSLSRR